MKKILVVLLVVACSEKKTESSLSPEAFNTKYKNTPGAILLDVRSEAEVKEGALPNAQNIVYNNSFGDKLGGLSREVPVFVYCAAGKRSARAAEILKEKGFKVVYQLKGGLDAWREARLPL